MKIINILLCAFKCWTPKKKPWGTTLTEGVGQDYSQ